jgi:hypothetical protein
MMKERIAAHFREQAAFCSAYGSPFTGALCERFADDIEAGGVVAALLSGWTSNPRADAVALRLCGALHAAALSRRDMELASLYPPGAWSMEAIWPTARAFLAREQEWVQGFLQYPPQTNETRRSIVLLAGFLAFAETWGGPIDMLEVGASAGLNLNWDKFSYKTSSWSWGPEGEVLIDTDWQAPAPPVSATPRIRNRAACDLNPLDIRDAKQALRLKSYVWADQAERLARFDGALKLALAHNVVVERADAAEWLARKLAARAQDAATIVYHSVFLQYPPRETREAIVAAIRNAGAGAGTEAPLAWVRLEPEAVTDGVENGLRFVVDLHTWPGGGRRILAYTDGHVRSVWAE